MGAAAAQAKNHLATVLTLRLDEIGMIGSSPNAILAEGTDWRFLNELKRELKA